MTWSRGWRDFWEESPEVQTGVHYPFPSRLGSSGKLPIFKPPTRMISGDVGTKAAPDQSPSHSCTVRPAPFMSDAICVCDGNAIFERDAYTRSPPAIL